MTANTKPTYPPTKQKVLPFARYAGTSAWRKYKDRVREYAHYRASLAAGHKPASAAG